MLRCQASKSSEDQVEDPRASCPPGAKHSVHRHQQVWNGMTVKMSHC